MQKDSITNDGIQMDANGCFISQLIKTEQKSRRIDVNARHKIVVFPPLFFELFLFHLWFFVSVRGSIGKKQNIQQTEMPKSRSEYRVRTTAHSLQPAKRTKCALANDYVSCVVPVE